MDDDKVKRTFYLNPEVNTALNQYIITQCKASETTPSTSTYGLTSYTVNQAISQLCVLPTIEEETEVKPKCAK